MSDAPPATAEPTNPPGPPGPPNTRSATLLGLLGRLLDVGRALIDDLQQRNQAGGPSRETAWTFGSLSLTLIIARITRGILLAQALQDRIIRRAKTLDAPYQTRTRPEPDGPRPPRTNEPPIDEATELANLPTARDIAARIRHKKIGVVITEICRDIGIDGEHPMWREVLDAITFNAGSSSDLLNVLHQRRLAAIKAGIRPTMPQTGSLSTFFRMFGQDPPPPAWSPTGWATPPP